MEKETKKYHHLRELTPVEAKIAEENHDLVFKFLNYKHLNHGEWYDVVIFHYLRQIQRYVTDPNLQKYDLRNLLFSVMDKGMKREMSKGSVSVENVISLEDPLPWLDNLTYGDIVTTEHLKYRPSYSKSDIRNMKASRLKEARSHEE